MLQQSIKTIIYNLNLLSTKPQSIYREQNKIKEIINIIPKGTLTLTKTSLLFLEIYLQFRLNCFLFL
jgi:hypothetical protein